MTKIFFPITDKKDSPWERQFLLQEVLPKVDIVEVSSVDIVDVNYFKNINTEELAIQDNIYVFSTNYGEYEDIKEVVEFLKPKLVVCLSDEWGNKKEFQELSKYTTILLRQYYYSHYPRFKNIHYLPLGYGNGMLEPDYLDISLKPPNERKYAWSFVGKQKKRSKYMRDRLYMLKYMKRMRPSLVTETTKEEMREIYRDSIFVPCGRGNANLDCFRLYEATVCGAIPIVVGSRRELDKTFIKEGKPPWIFAKDWEHALKVCKELCKRPLLLLNNHKRLLRWWKKRVSNINELVSTVV